LNLIELKVSWGGIYKDETGEDSTNILEVIRKESEKKYNITIHSMENYLKFFMG
jgi:allophanate hydrolase subunit 1